MPKSIKVFQVDAFTQTLFTGNPAGVVLGAEVLSDDEMLAIARELNNGDTAFVLHPRATITTSESGFSHRGPSRLS